MIVKISANDKGNPPGKLADAELHFEAPNRAEYETQLHRLADAGKDDAQIMLAKLYQQAQALAGLKLIGFGIWERRTGGERNVTFPARSYTVNGERRSFALLRPISDAQDRIRETILQAYAEWADGPTIEQARKRDQLAELTGTDRTEPELGHDTGRKLETAGQQLGNATARALRF